MLVGLPRPYATAVAFHVPRRVTPSYLHCRFLRHVCLFWLSALRDAMPFDLPWIDLLRCTMSRCAAPRFACDDGAMRYAMREMISARHADMLASIYGGKRCAYGLFAAPQRHCRAVIAATCRDDDAANDVGLGFGFCHVAN